MNLLTLWGEGGRGRKGRDCLNKIKIITHQAWDKIEISKIVNLYKHNVIHILKGKKGHLGNIKFKNDKKRVLYTFKYRQGKRYVGIVGRGRGGKIRTIGKDTRIFSKI